MRRLALALALPLLAASAAAEAGPIRFPLEIRLSYCATGCAAWSETMAHFAGNGTFTTDDGMAGTWRASRGRVTLWLDSGEVWTGQGIGDRCAAGAMWQTPAAPYGDWAGCAVPP
ncbi:MAG TPA: hypothetical protein PKA64_24560 [Myxococcota bacterium]|nr:hypothetical protein [Myxococcota bacterium]